jgi:hypothetical protein
MELQEFIKNTLVQITNGVIDAQKELIDSGCLLNPEGFTMQGGQIKQGYKNEYRAIQSVKMNVILEVNESEGSTKGIGVAKVLSAGYNSDKLHSNSQFTSVAFEIPLALPIMENN